ncbi:MAG: TIGR03960 family B12-binding radical SAM protein [Leptolyngbyaceae bacterium]|nr:TIGR03960 family B12-binding radical SAM protein [Leptolyngbyaceae bacterium]
MPTDVHALIDTTLARPARYLGNELGAVHKPWNSALVRWVLTYPEVYEVGSSNLGHIILYSILNAQPRQLCDRAYLPNPDLATRLRTTNTPLFAVESKRSLTNFDILGFSLSYELGATNVLEMLSLAGIPLTSQERSASGPWSVESGSYPLIFAGGQTATGNPEPYADFFDFIALGDGEELLPEMGLVLEEGKANQLSREELLLDLAQVPGVYVPQFYQVDAHGAVTPTRPDVPPRILRRVATPMPAYSIGLVPYVETVHDRLTVEVRRGCTRGCRFCQPGMLTRPARDVEPEQVIDTIERGMRATGYNEFSLLSLSCSDYLSLPAVGLEVRNRLKQDNISLSLPSQRVDRFDENIANIVGGTRKSGLTFAPEAGTQRLRDIINKGLTNEELLRGIKTAYEQGWDRVKLYFMIGLPGETDADVIGIAETIRWLKQECHGSRRRPLNFNVTISNFTPKPHTPFQWHSVSTREFERKQRLLKEEFRTIRGLKANFTDVRISAMEDFLGRGDRRLSQVILNAWQQGAGMDSWWESLEQAFAAWTAAIDASDLTWKYRQVEQGEWNLFETDVKADAADAESDVADPGKEEPGSPRLPDLEVPLPWDHIDTGISKQWLKDDLIRALEAATVPDCAFEGCSHCGVCGPDLGHNVVVPPPPLPAFEGEFVPNQTREQRLRVWMGKQGDMALLGHLDLVRLLDRAVRRAALPLAFTGGYHPGPRISPANALPLGATSSGEIIDFELTTEMDIGEFRQRLGNQLPEQLPIGQVEAIALSEPSATQCLAKAEYWLWIGTSDAEVSDNQDTPAPALQWQLWLDQMLSATELWVEKTTKSGKRQRINMRDRLFELERINPPALSTDGWDNLLPSSVGQIWTLQGRTTSMQDSAIIRYIGSCRNDGSLLRPNHLLALLEETAQQPLQLLHVHRHQLLLEP